MTEVILECWTDGSTIKRKNSGRGDCGIGYAVTDGNDVLFCGAEFIGTQTSNYAEMYAILRCLEEVADKVDGEVMTLTVYSDSEVCIKGLQGDYNIKSPNLLPLVKKIEALYGDLPAEPEYQWVRGHSGEPLNEFVDKLAYVCSTGYPYDN